MKIMVHAGLFLFLVVLFSVQGFRCIMDDGAAEGGLNKMKSFIFTDLPSVSMTVLVMICIAAAVAYAIVFSF